MNDNKFNNISWGFIKSEPLTNHFERPLGLYHTYEEIDSLKEQFDRCDELTAKEIKKLLSVTLKFIVETSNTTKDNRANNPNSKNIVLKSIKDCKEIHEALKKQLAGMTDVKAKPILEAALTYSLEAIDKRFKELGKNEDPILEYANEQLLDFFKKNESTRVERRY